MNESTQQSTTPIDTYDRMLGALDGIPGASSTKPTTIATVIPVVGTSQTYIVRTFRQQQVDPDGKPKPATFTVFLQHVEGNRAVKLVLPPKVSEAIARQREALTGRARRQTAKATMQARIDAGFVPDFGGKRGRRKSKQS